MAIYHLSVKAFSRSAGRSATGAAAYRAGVDIRDERTGDRHRYSRKGGVLSADIVLPAGAPEWAADRSALWNAAEQAEGRKNSTVAREFEIALPAELPADDRRQLALDFARELVDRHGFAADVCVHEPGRGNDLNHHAHILVTTRRLTAEGIGEKTRELDAKATGTKLVEEWRARYAALQNERLQLHGSAARVDHRSLREQGIEREPTVHLGPVAAAIERKGIESRRRIEAPTTQERKRITRRTRDRVRRLRLLDVPTGLMASLWRRTLDAIEVAGAWWKVGTEGWKDVHRGVISDAKATGKAMAEAIEILYEHSPGTAGETPQDRADDLAWALMEDLAEPDQEPDEPDLSRPGF